VPPASTTSPRVASSPIVSHQGTDVTDVENPEKPLVAETPAGDGDTPQHDDPPQSTIDAVTPLQTEIVNDDTVNDTIHPTLDMTTGMANVQQLRDGTPLLYVRNGTITRVLSTLWYIHIVP